jgi:hypothetical protein
MKAAVRQVVFFAAMIRVGTVSAEATMVHMCDLTGNGTVSSLDASYVLQFVAGTRDLTPTQQMLADASGNGVVTAFDATRILQAASGKVMPGSHCGQLVFVP